MGVKIAFGTGDPQRFRDDYFQEARWGRLFSHVDKAVLFQRETAGRLADLSDMLDARPNATGGTGDRVVTLAGTQGVRGTRAHSVIDPLDAFTEWEAWVSFPSAFPAPPTVTVTAESSGEVIHANIRDVTASGFYARLTTASAVTSMTFHFQAWGDS